MILYFLPSIYNMKSAYEKAMERFGGDEPIKQLTDEQKAALAEIEDKYKAKIAEKELFLGEQLKKATEEGNFMEIPQIEEQMRREIAKLEKDRDEEKDKIRGG